jgi:hypothetical protein
MIQAQRNGAPFNSVKNKQHLNMSDNIDQKMS